MASPKRKSGTPLKKRLFAEYYNFEFFQAVRLLEAFLPDKKRLGQTMEPQSEVVRFSVKPGLSFPPSDISRMQPGGQDGPAKMEVAFMGLVGPSGVLPRWYTELVVRRIWHKDFSLAAFLDLFHHRLVSMFYLAWKKNRFDANYIPDARDRHSRYLLSLAGLGTPGLVDHIGLPAESLVFYSGLLSRGPASVSAIETTVNYFAGNDVHIEQFVEQVLTIDPEDRTRLGSANVRLGIDTLCGTQMVDCRNRFRIRLGPLEFDAYRRFLPTGELLGLISNLVRTMVGMEFEFDFTVALKKEAVPVCRLGAEAPNAPLLGWTTWARSPDFHPERDPQIVFPELSLREKTTTAMHALPDR